MRVQRHFPSTTKLIEDKNLEEVWRFQHLSPKSQFHILCEKVFMIAYGGVSGHEDLLLNYYLFLYTRIPHRMSSFILVAVPIVESHSICIYRSSLSG